MIAASRRPFTGMLNDAAIELMLASTAVHVEEHLIHAWKALEEASRASRTVGGAPKVVGCVRNATTRARCAEEGLSRLLGEELEAARAELAILRDEIHFAG